MAELQQLVDGLCQRTTAYSDWMNRVERLIDGLETEKAGTVCDEFFNTVACTYMYVYPTVCS